MNSLEIVDYSPEWDFTQGGSKILVCLKPANLLESIDLYCVCIFGIMTTLAKLLLGFIPSPFSALGDLFIKSSAIVFKNVKTTDLHPNRKPQHAS
jgi:hypothetical protein